MLKTIFKLESHIYPIVFWLTRGLVITILCITGYLSLFLIAIQFFETGNILNDLSALEVLSTLIVFILCLRINFYCKKTGQGPLTSFTRIGVGLAFAAAFATLIISFHALTQDLIPFRVELPPLTQLITSAVYVVILYFMAPPTDFFTQEEMFNKTEPKLPSTDETKEINTKKDSQNEA